MWRYLIWDVSTAWKLIMFQRYKYFETSELGLGNEHNFQLVYIEKTIFPFPFTLNEIWSWWQFSNRFSSKWKSIWFKIEKKTVHQTVYHNRRGYRPSGLSRFRLGAWRSRIESRIGSSIKSWGCRWIKPWLSSSIKSRMTIGTKSWRYCWIKSWRTILVCLTYSCPRDITGTQLRAPLKLFGPSQHYRIWGVRNMFIIFPLFSQNAWNLIKYIFITSINIYRTYIHNSQLTKRK